MMSIAEALGVCFLVSLYPCPGFQPKRAVAACGGRVVAMVLEGTTLDKIISQASVENAVKVAMASGCSTNAIIHLIAIARRAGLELGLDDLTACRRKYLYWQISGQQGYLSDGRFLLCWRPASLAKAIATSWIFL